MAKKQLDITFYEDVVAQRAKTWLDQDINKAKTEGRLDIHKQPKCITIIIWENIEEGQLPIWHWVFAYKGLNPYTGEQPE